MRLARPAPRKPRIEIIPLIDTVFFLLVFFMMASLSMTVYRGLPVSLPKATGQPQIPDETAAVTVDREGHAYLNRQAVDMTTLRDGLHALIGARPDLLVIVSADEQVTHGRVVDAMDAARAAGVARLAIAVRPGDSR